jgi:hypothetical protein
MAIDRRADGHRFQLAAIPASLILVFYSVSIIAVNAVPSRRFKSLNSLSRLLSAVFVNKLMPEGTYGKMNWKITGNKTRPLFTCYGTDRRWQLLIIGWTDVQKVHNWVNNSALIYCQRNAHATTWYSHVLTPPVHFQGNPQRCDRKDMVYNIEVANFKHQRHHCRIRLNDDSHPISHE